MAELTPNEDALVAYEAAEERARIFRKAWEEAGQPLLADGSMRQPIPHPLVKMIHEAEVLADRLRKNVQHRHRGPAPTGVVMPMRRVTRKAS